MDKFENEDVHLDRDSSSETEGLGPLHHNDPRVDNYLQNSTIRRRASLDIQQLLEISRHSQARRSSVDSLAPSIASGRRPSLGEDTLRLHLLKRSCFSSITGTPSCGRRLSIESESASHNSCRRSSLGAESLIEYDLEETTAEKETVIEPPPEALLGLQYADDVFSVKRNLEKRFHPKNCLAAQPQV